jgi:uncharacterized pyridoxal phosphate-containing UPF0001 family protein
VSALAKAMDKTGRRLPCFVQVNIGAEEQKGGCAVADLPALLEQARVADLPVAGLMCVPPADLEPRPSSPCWPSWRRTMGFPAFPWG